MSQVVAAVQKKNIVADCQGIVQLQPQPKSRSCLTKSVVRGLTVCSVDDVRDRDLDAQALDCFCLQDKQLQVLSDAHNKHMKGH